jgi:hypothetical protein
MSSKTASNSNADKSNTNYSESDPHFSSASSASSSNSSPEVVFGKTITVIPRKKVRFTRRRRVRKADKTLEAVQARKSIHKKKSKGPYVTKNMDAENIQILKNATKRLSLTKKEKQERAWVYIDYLRTLKEESDENFLTEEQRDFIKDHILGHLKK